MPGRRGVERTSSTSSPGKLFVRRSRWRIWGIWKRSSRSDEASSTRWNTTRLEEEATGTAPQERLNLREGSYELVEAIPWYEAKLARLDERRRDLAAEIHKRSAEVEREATGTFFDRILATPQNLSTFGEGGKEDPVATGEGEREALSRSVRRLDPTIATKHKSATGFVTFRSLRSCSVARQAQLSPRPFCMESCPQRPAEEFDLGQRADVQNREIGAPRLRVHRACVAGDELEFLDPDLHLHLLTSGRPNISPRAPYLVKLGYNIFSAYLPIMLVQAVLALLPFPLPGPGGLLREI